MASNICCAWNSPAAGTNRRAPPSAGAQGRSDRTEPMIEWAFAKLEKNYILVMTIATRIFGSVGGFLVLYYVNFTTRLPEEMRRHFDLLGAGMVVIAVAGTVPLAMSKTRGLRRVLRKMRAGQPLSVVESDRAAREAVLFPARE